MKSSFNTTSKSSLNQPSKVSFVPSSSKSSVMSLTQIDSEIARLRSTLSSSITQSLPDKGQRIKDKILALEKQRDQSISQPNNQESNQSINQISNQSIIQSAKPSFDQSMRVPNSLSNDLSSSDSDSQLSDSDSDAQPDVPSYLDTHIPAPRTSSQSINAHVFNEDDIYAMRRANKSMNRSNNQSNNPSKNRRSRELTNQPIEQSEDALASLLSSLSLADQATDQTINQTNQSAIQSANQSVNPGWVDSSIKTKLFPHQLTALQWMLKRESLINQSVDEPSKPTNKRSGKQSVSRSTNQSSSQWSPPGGILADDCGLGKTLTIIALIATNPSDEQSINQSEDQSVNLSKGTLIVCPRGLINQWKHEISIHTTNQWNVVDYQDIKQSIKQASKPSAKQSVKESINQSIRDQLINADVIIINYEAVAIEAKALINQSKDESDGESIDQSILLSLKYRRVVLDEAHRIRNQSINQSKAINLIDCSFRWCCTATPINNSIDDLFAFFIFLKYAPYDQKAFWKQSTNQSTDQSANQSTNLERIATVLRSIMIRRTKFDQVLVSQSTNQSANQSINPSNKQPANQSMKQVINQSVDDGDDLSSHMNSLSINQPVYRPLIEMVDRTIKVHKINQAAWETHFYQSFSTLCKQRARSINQSTNQYALILAMLVRMRQAADHFFLTFKRKIKDNDSIEDSVNQSINQSVNHPINQSLNQSVNQPINQLEMSDPVFAAARAAAKLVGVDLPLDHEGQFDEDAFNQSVDQSISESISQSTSQSINQSISQSVSQSTNQSISQSVKKSNSQPVQQPLNQSVKQSIETFVDPSLFDIVPVQSKPINQSINQPIDQTSQSVSQSVNQSVTQSNSAPRRIPKKPQQASSYSVKKATSNQTVNQSIDQSTDPSSKQSSSQSVNQSANQSATPVVPSTYFDCLAQSGKMAKILEIIHDIGIRPSNRSINQSTNQSINQSVNQSTDEKIVIFSQFTQYLDLIAYVLERLGHSNIARFDGRQSTINQSINLTNFNSLSNECSILLVSLTAGGVGLNLSRANHVIISDLWFNPAVETQCMDRVHRLSQNRPVYVHRLCSHHTVEVELFEMQTRKQEIADRALGGKKSKDEENEQETNPINAKLTMEALKRLFGLDKEQSKSIVDQR